MTLPEKKSEKKLSIKDMTTLIYGAPKIGKSTFCSQSENALFLSTEPGLNALSVYKVDVRSWSDFLSACGEIAKGKHNYKTIVIDTIDNLHKSCAEYVCQKHGIEHESDLSFGKGFKLVQDEFARAINKLAFLPYGLILVSHAQEKELETAAGKRLKILPTLPDKVHKFIAGLADIILYCDIERKTDDKGKTTQRRVVRTKPSATYEAGDRTGLLPATISLDYKELEKYFDNKN